ncbi:hypothetical protein Metal_4031 (plasmid) [Methylomicrobium album BG8]|uniref:Uncharacterized protein n=2 Tax=Methylomicrobium album TaxID=39775 RepID=H8GRL9_METAL|nr:hypothetical protein Metal_4031 [Methylomicrobium album BG8]
MQAEGWRVLGLCYKSEFSWWYSQVSPDRDVFCGFGPDDNRIEIWIRDRTRVESEEGGSANEQ